MARYTPLQNVLYYNGALLHHCLHFKCLCKYKCMHNTYIKYSIVIYYAFDREIYVIFKTFLKTIMIKNYISLLKYLIQALKSTKNVL